MKKILNLICLVCLIMFLFMFLWFILDFTLNNLYLTVVTFLCFLISFFSRLSYIHNFIEK